MKIAIIGTQNTGKSTFLTDLITAFPHYTTPTETYRDVVEQRGLKINQQTSEESQRALRDFLFDQVKNAKGENVLFDRSVIDNFVYTSLAHDRGAVTEAFLKETETMMLKSLDLLDRLFFVPTAVSIRLDDDNLRDVDTHFIDQVNYRFIETLLDVSKKKKVAIDIIAGSREERVARAKTLLS